MGWQFLMAYLKLHDRFSDRRFWWHDHEEILKAPPANMDMFDISRAAPWSMLGFPYKRGSDGSNYHLGFIYWKQLSFSATRFCVILMVEYRRVNWFVLQASKIDHVYDEYTCIYIYIWIYIYIYYTGDMNGYAEKWKQNMMDQHVTYPCLSGNRGFVFNIVHVVYVYIHIIRRSSKEHWILVTSFQSGSHWATEKWPMSLFWLVVSNMSFMFHFIYGIILPIGHWRTPSFFKMVIAPPTFFFPYIH